MSLLLNVVDGKPGGAIRRVRNGLGRRESVAMLGLTP